MSQFRRLKVEIEGPSRPFLDQMSKQMREKVLQIAKNNNRTQEEAEILYKYIKGFSFFETYLQAELNIEEEGIIYLVKMLRYRTLRPRELVFKEGDPSNGRCYLVFSGEILVVRSQLDEIMRENIKKAFLQKMKPTHAKTHKREDSHYQALLSMNSEAMKILASATKHNNTPDASQPSSPTSTKRPGKTAFGQFNPALSRRGSTIATPKRRDSFSKDSPLRSDKAESNPSSPKNSNSKNEHKGTSRFAAAFNENDFNPEPDDEYGYVKDRIYWGGYFGERAMTENSKRGATIVAARASEVLWFHFEDFKFIRKKYDKQKRMLLKFLTDIFPSLDLVKDEDVKEALIYVMEERTFDKGRTIVQQDEYDEHFYVVLDGVFEISKEFEIEAPSLLIDAKHSSTLPLFNQKQARHEKFRLCELGRGMIFGEEIMINDTERYEYSVSVASTRGTLLVFDRRKFAMRFPKEVYHDVYTMFNRKKKDYMDIVDKELTRKNIKFEWKREGNRFKLKLIQNPFRAEMDPQAQQEKERLKKKFIEFRNGDYVGGELIMKKELTFNKKKKTGETSEESLTILDFISPREARIPPPRGTMHSTKLRQFTKKLKLNLDKIHPDRISSTSPDPMQKKISLTERTLRMESPNGFVRTWDEIRNELSSREVPRTHAHKDHESDPNNLVDIDQFRLFPRHPPAGFLPGHGGLRKNSPQLESPKPLTSRTEKLEKGAVTLNTLTTLDNINISRFNYGFPSPFAVKKYMDDPDLGLLDVLTQRVSLGTQKSRQESIDINKRKKFVNMHVELKTMLTSKESGSVMGLAKESRSYSRNSEESMRLTKIFTPRIKKKGSNLTSGTLPSVDSKVESLLLINPLNSKSEK